MENKQVRQSITNANIYVITSLLVCTKTNLFSPTNLLHSVQNHSKLVNSKQLRYAGTNNHILLLDTYQVYGWTIIRISDICMNMLLVAFTVKVTEMPGRPPTCRSNVSSVPPSVHTNALVTKEKEGNCILKLPT